MKSDSSVMAINNSNGTSKSNLKASADNIKSQNALAKNKSQSNSVLSSGAPAHHIGGFGIHHTSHYYHNQVDASREFAATEASNLFRTLVLDQSHARLKKYEPESITVRTNKQISSRTDAMIMQEKEKRRAALETSGFASKAKKAYTPLGQPILDPVELVLFSLMVNPAVASELSDDEEEKLAFMAAKAKTSNNLTNRLKEITLPTKANKDYDVIKSQLEACSLRIRIVKFGVPLKKMLEITANSQKISEEKARVEALREKARNAIYTATEASSKQSDNSTNESVVDWKSLVFNSDKMNQILAHIELRKQVDPQMVAFTGSPFADAISSPEALKANAKSQKKEEILDAVSESRNVPGTNPEDDATAPVDDERVAIERALHKVSQHLQKLAAKANGFGGLCIPYNQELSSPSGSSGSSTEQPVKTNDTTSKPAAVSQNAELLESKLHIKRNMDSLQTMESFFGARDSFYEQQSRLSVILQEDFENLNCSRDKDTAMRYNTLKISTNFKFSHDIEDMRKFLAHDYKRRRVQKLVNHKWYSELVSKLLYPPSGVPNRTLSPYEELVVTRLVNMIINDISLKNVVSFSRLCKGIPPKIFAQEDIQRLVRFIKSKEAISEQDYVTALDLSGQSPVTSEKSASSSAVVQSTPAFSSPTSPSLIPSPAAMPSPTLQPISQAVSIPSLCQ